jgi:flagellar assembly factor FliW
MQEEFKQSWSVIKEQRRIEIHINSYSVSDLRRMSLEKYKQRENSQLSRIFRLKDPNVDVIYVSPYLMTSEVTKYYMKILELVEIENAASRLHIIVPENYVKFSEHLSLTQALLYSPKAC